MTINPELFSARDKANDNPYFKAIANMQLNRAEGLLFNACFNSPALISIICICQLFKRGAQPAKQ